MPDLEQAADQVVADSAELQQVLRGERAVLVPPGSSAFVAVNLLLMLSWGGILPGLLAPWRQALPDHASAVASVLSIPLAALAFSIPAIAVVRGHPAAARAMRRVALGFLVLAVAAALSSEVADGASPVRRGFAWASIATTLLAWRLTSTATYALAAAFFRAKRATRETHARKRDQLHGKH